jgi:hypothetical protein
VTHIGGTPSRWAIRAATIVALILPPPIAGAAAKAEEVQSFTVGSLDLRLVEEGGKCVVLPAGATEPKLVLDLAVPCHILLWRDPPPTGTGAQADGVAVGKAGEAMAWQFPDLGTAIHAAVIGDEIDPSLKESLTYKTRMEQGFHCAGSVQALVIENGMVQAGRKRTGQGILCAETGLEQAGFWLLAHQ